MALQERDKTDEQDGREQPGPAVVQAARQPVHSLAKRAEGPRDFLQDPEGVRHACRWPRHEPFVPEPPKIRLICRSNGVQREHGGAVRARSQRVHVTRNVRAARQSRSSPTTMSKPSPVPASTNTTGCENHAAAAPAAPSVSARIGVTPDGESRWPRTARGSQRKHRSNTASLATRNR